MDLRALEYTRAHYDKHSNQFENTKEALQARAQGPGAPLKKFHNTIKRRLIERFATGAGCLLDLACGRGGDIWKWIDAGISEVKGLDLSPGEIEEARKRFSEAAEKRPDMSLDYQFEDTPLLGVQEWREPRQYDVVTCMFAIHYFFVTEAALKQFLHNVSINLKDGGYFIGTVPDGKRVNECIKQSKKYQSPMLTIEAHWKGMPEVFGSPYICAIGDTVTGGEKGTQGSYEYLVYTNVLAGVAAQYGLKPVLQYDDADLDHMFEREDAGKPLKHFAPYFPKSDPSLAQASKLFAAFVFQKTSGTPAPPRAMGAAASAPPAAAAGGKRKADGGGEAPRPMQRRRPGLLKAPAAGGATQQQQEQQPQPAAGEQQQQQVAHEQQQAGGEPQAAESAPEAAAAAAAAEEPAAAAAAEDEQAAADGGS
ncbi:Golgi apparatus membrane ECHIDNA [Micractinium conductrix]|uniref:mRNA (guanine-N(7))-methyltransferase n=1 Tax=Micractinium conductrix TaxID=554055 RepID=A0A2P6VC19_9CHLO|nr:Golgi apparatus membrane ECHIDNA [Micractinium conductrix]PSC71601.1 Golgi apparatus membrane ECHIDNA [Micractinium conductrix]|eukprot:PSC71583.1 Golgi apparatus membrane ECHIDNA [Micractinium conductrix]